MLLQEPLDDPVDRFVIGQAEAHQLHELVTGDLANGSLMGQLGIGVPGLERGCGLVGAIIHNDGITFDMPETFGTGFNGGIEILF